MISSLYLEAIHRTLSYSGTAQLHYTPMTVFYGLTGINPRIYKPSRIHPVIAKCYCCGNTVTDQQFLPKCHRLECKLQFARLPCLPTYIRRYSELLQLVHTNFQEHNDGYIRNT